MTESVRDECRGWTRRRILASGGTAVLLMSAPACDALSTEPGGREGESGASNGPEAPMLAEQVEAGTLPPVDERLPDGPLVLEPVESVGRYGGTLNSWYQGPGATYVLANQLRYENLVAWNIPWTDVVPNIARAWEVNDDGREFVFELRRGMKWSDGEPFSAADIVFAYDHALMNPELSPVPSDVFRVGSETAVLEEVDDHTIRFVFKVPNGLFLENLCTVAGNGLFIPRHYMEEFHKDYNDTAAQLAEDEGFDAWTDLFWSRNDPLVNADRPVLDAWIAVTPPGDGTEQAEFERNPYYWKVDPDGSQLPYLDRVVYPVISDLNTALLKTTNGEIDLNFPRAAASPLTPENKPVLAQSTESGDYRLVDAETGLNNAMVLAFNLTHLNSVKREIFGNKDFRIGLSYAINRAELIKIVLQRQGEPHQAAPTRDSGLYHETLAKQYTEFDVDLAGSHLDRAGLTERDGRRIGPDGEPVLFTVDVATEEPDQVRALELIREYWNAVGIDMHLKPVDRNLFYTRKGANEHDANMWTGAGGLRAGIYLDVRWYLPSTSESNFAIPWAAWYTSGGTDGEEPSEPAKRQQQLLDELKGTLDDETKNDLLRQILDIAAEEFWAIGLASPAGVYGTVRNELKNVPTLIGSWTYANEGPARPAQFFKS